MPEFTSNVALPDDLDRFTMGYVTCALWLLSDSEGEPCDDFNGEISAEAWAVIRSDCADFQASFRSLLDRANEAGRDDDELGHDFFLTRNGHGTGFWDRGLGTVGDELTKMAHPYGEFGLYIGENDTLYPQ